MILDARSVEGVEEDGLHALADVRRVAVAGHEHEAGEEAAEVLASHEQPHSLAALELQHAHRRHVEDLRRGLEQLVAWVGLQHVDEGLAAVAPRRESGPLDHRLHLAAQHRDLLGPCPLDRGGIQAEEPPLTHRSPQRVEPLDPEVVEMPGAVHGGPCVRLGEDQQVRFEGDPADLGRQLGEAEGDGGLVLPEDAEARASRGAKGVVATFVDELVLPVAEEDEAAVANPLQQRPGLRHLVGIDPRRLALELIGDLQGAPGASPASPRPPHVRRRGPAARSSRSSASTPASLWRSISARTKASETAPSPAPSSASPTRCPAASRTTVITGWTMRWTPWPCRFSSMLNESTRNGMSSVTTATAVCVEAQPSTSKSGV